MLPIPSYGGVDERMRSRGGFWRSITFTDMRTVFFFLFITHSLCAQNISGKWRGEFTIQDSIKVPFNFEIDKNNAVTLINGEEKFFGGKATIDNDSVFVPMDQFDNIFVFHIKNGDGVLRKQDGSTNLAYFKIEKGNYRFKEREIKPKKDFSGTYEVVFDPGGKEDVAVGLFKQKGNKLTATFMKSSGDTRYQEGIVEGNKFYLSSFIGSTPGYYYGKFKENGELKGEQVGTTLRQYFKGKLNEGAKLPDAYAISRVKDSAFNFSLPDVNGKMVSLNNFKGKPVIVAITGTWCPNCIDEANFLSPWYNKNKDRGIEIIAVHFERSNDTAYARKVMTRYKERFNIGYTQLFGGTTAKEDVMKALPGLDKFSAFPTTIFIDKTGQAVKVHTGFSGPATGRYYEDFIQEFDAEVNSLVK
jgi:peroxiredoxin